MVSRYRAALKEAVCPIMSGPLPNTVIKLTSSFPLRILPDPAAGRVDGEVQE